MANNPKNHLDYSQFPLEILFPNSNETLLIVQINLGEEVKDKWYRWCAYDSQYTSETLIIRLEGGPGTVVYACNPNTSEAEAEGRLSPTVWD